MLKAYLSVKSSSLNAFVISKTHIVAQKLPGRQLNTKVCGSKVPFLLFFLSFLWHLHSFNFTLVNKSHLQHSVAAVCCDGCHFVLLYACAQVVSFPDQILRSLVWEQDKSQAKSRVAHWHCMARSLLLVVDKVYEHHTGKALHSAANL